MNHAISFCLLYPITILLLSHQLLDAQPNERRIENDPNARVLLDAVYEKYHAAPSVKIQFSLSVDTPEEQAYIKSQGTVYLKKDKYKIDTEEMTIICDNVKRYVYLKEPNELQISYFEPGEEEVESPSKFFELYKKDFFYRLGGETTFMDRRAAVVNLLPMNIKESPYKMIFLIVDKEKKQILKAEILSKDGTRYTYVLTAIEETSNLPDEEFTFDPSRYPGIYIDDMTK
ncbi:MAG: hypothetical protein KatS3mg031_2599 [Chitinophagales bacterium]|nr:MAG: hypothetical protein KatS3mg031_2599 [Chitinophagales bacterium]